MMTNALAMRLNNLAAELRAKHANDEISPGVRHPDIDDAALIDAGASELEKQTRERLSFLERFANPPIMEVPTSHEDARDARSWRYLTALPWWLRLWHAAKLTRL